MFTLKHFAYQYVYDNVFWKCTEMHWNVFEKGNRRNVKQNGGFLFN